MHRRYILVSILALTLLMVLVGLVMVDRGPAVRAQDATATPADDSATASSAVTETTPLAETTALTETAELSATAEATGVLVADAPQAYVNLDLSAGFALDPFLVSANGGGSVDASTMAEGCVGFISENPVLTLDWEGDAEMARIFFFSDHDPSLVIEGPDGTVFCSDDAHDALLDPSVDLESPAKGRYNIWVGNQDDDSLIPGILVLTLRPDIDVDTFQLTGLIKRPAIPGHTDEADEAADGADTEEDAVNDHLEEMPESVELREQLAAELADATEVRPFDEGMTLTATAELTGEIPGFMLPVNPDSPQPLCAGISNPDSVLTFSVPEGLETFRVFVESSADSTLQLLTPDGDFLCTDESPDHVNRNPLIDVANPAPGNYAVVVGRLSVDDTADAFVTVTTDLSLEPALLEAESAESN